MEELKLEAISRNHIGEEEKAGKYMDCVTPDVNGSNGSDMATKCSECYNSVSLWTLLPAVVIACIMSLLGGTTLSYSSSTLLELNELANPHFRFDNALLSDLFGVS